MLGRAVAAVGLRRYDTLSKSAQLTHLVQMLSGAGLLGTPRLPRSFALYPAVYKRFQYALHAQMNFNRCVLETCERR